MVKLKQLIYSDLFELFHTILPDHPSSVYSPDITLLIPCLEHLQTIGILAVLGFWEELIFWIRGNQLNNCGHLG